MQERIAKCLSKPRLAKYGPNLQVALTNYQRNIDLSESLYPLIHILEVGLRNRLHQEVGRLLKQNNWLISKDPAIMERLHPHWIQKWEFSRMCCSK